MPDTTQPPPLTVADRDRIRARTGAALAAARNSTGLSARTLGEWCGYAPAPAQSRISRAERGLSPIDLDEALILVHACGTTLRQVLARSGVDGDEPATLEHAIALDPALSADDKHLLAALLASMRARPAERLRRGGPPRIDAVVADLLDLSERGRQQVWDVVAAQVTPPSGAPQTPRRRSAKRRVGEVNGD